MSSACRRQEEEERQEESLRHLTSNTNSLTPSSQSHQHQTLNISNNKIAVATTTAAAAAKGKGKGKGKKTNATPAPITNNIKGRKEEERSSALSDLQNPTPAPEAATTSIKDAAAPSKVPEVREASCSALFGTPIGEQQEKLGGTTTKLTLGDSTTKPSHAMTVSLTSSAVTPSTARGSTGGGVGETERGGGPPRSRTIPITQEVAWYATQAGKELTQVRPLRLPPPPPSSPIQLPIPSSNSSFLKEQPTYLHTSHEVVEEVERGRSEEEEEEDGEEDEEKEEKKKGQ